MRARHGIGRELRPNHQARPIQHPFAVSQFNGAIDRRRQPEVVGFKNNLFQASVWSQPAARQRCGSGRRRSSSICPQIETSATTCRGVLRAAAILVSWVVFLNEESRLVT